MNRTTAAQRANARYDKIWAQYEAQKESETTRFNPSSRQEGGEMTHTPGPWTIDWSTDEIISFDASEREIRIAAVLDADANARLIAAAPALLEALEGAVAMLNKAGRDRASTEYLNAAREAHAAIMLAKP